LHSGIQQFVIFHPLAQQLQPERKFTAPGSMPIKLFVK
jgi:hypothetical protein